MKHHIFKSALAAIALSLSCATQAQVALRSGYFLEGYNYRHQLNPALAPSHDYFALPVIGGTNVSLRSNIGINNILYTKPGTNDLMLFTNRAVNKAEFLNALKNHNTLGADINFMLVSDGFAKWGGYNTIEASIRADVYANIPKGLFEFIKDAHTGGDYAFDKFGASSQAYMELAFGHSRRINDEWRVGGKLKFLIGLYSMDVRVDNMTAKLDKDVWRLNGQGHLNMSWPFLRTSEPKSNGKIDFDNLDFDENDFGLRGFGMGINLGATYRPQQVEGLEVSMALNDFGFISWSKNLRGNMSNEWTFDGFNITEDDKDDKQYNGKTYNSFNTELKNLGDDLGNGFNFVQDQSATTNTRMLGATLNIGASYKLPMYDKLKFGFLSSTRINGVYSWSEGRFSANVSPVNCLDVAVNYAVSSFGHSFGWLVNLHLSGFGFYLGTDHQFGKVTPQFIPAGRANSNVAFGIVFNLNKAKNTKEYN